MAETLLLISKISFAAAGICLILAIIFFISFKIPNVIGDLSGRNARKSIEKMREFNEKSGSKAYKPSKTNAARGKLTETMREMRKKEQNQSLGEEQQETELLEENKKMTPSKLETELLYEDRTTELLQAENETELLEENIDEVSKRKEGVRIHIIEEIIWVHTEEVIS